MAKSFSTKMNECVEFFNRVAALLSSSHEVVKSCNNDASAYLIPFGTERYLTYYGKPYDSIRVSDHWNWYANTNKCSNDRYIQCLSVDAPWARKRPEKGKPSKPIRAAQVCIYGADRKYHVVFGERFNRKTKTWEWVESDPSKVLDYFA